MSLIRENLRSICIAILVSFISCEHEFIETDLSGKLVSIIAPADADTLPTATPIFWWNKINSARNYRVQIVYPDFTAPQQLLYDTAVDGDRFYPSLTPGYTYYWRIRAENGSSHGDWVTRSLTIDSTVSLSAQIVLITSPATNNYSTSSGTISFTWNSLTSADFYRIDVINTANNASVTNTTTTVNSFAYTFAEGNYLFKVRAENATSISPWSTRNFTIDQTAPAAPVLTAPANYSYYATVPPTLNFTWNSAADALTDSLYISTDSMFVAGIQLAQLLNSSQGNYSWAGAQSGNVYYWRVRSADAAGNRSNYSSKFRFTVN